MSKIIDLTGKRFGKLIVIEKGQSIKRPKGGTRVRWLCKCDCGNFKLINSEHLISNKIISCGCYKKEIMRSKNNINYKHGKAHTRLYNIYNNMKSRCYNKNNKRYKNYGRRGIIICDEWLNKESGFLNFYNWAMQNGYKDDLTIDRIDVNGNYEPNNCRWATAKEQMNNTTRNHYLIYKGQKYTMAQLSKIFKIKYDIFKKIIKRGGLKQVCQELKEKYEEIN